MNPKIDYIFRRRSIRKYSDKPVSYEVIKDILEAGMSAPSAVAKDPWSFIVFKDKDLNNRIADVLPNGQMLRDAAAGIVICGDIERAHGKELSYMLQDCCAAIQNMLLAISGLGLGACWLGVHPREERVAGVKSIFKLADNIIPVSIIALGYPAEKKEPRTRYNEKLVKWV